MSIRPYKAQIESEGRSSFSRCPRSNSASKVNGGDKPVIPDSQTIIEEEKKGKKPVGKALAKNINIFNKKFKKDKAAGLFKKNSSSVISQQKDLPNASREISAMDDDSANDNSAFPEPTEIKQMFRPEDRLSVESNENAKGKHLNIFKNAKKGRRK